ncbi:MFS transporter [Amycolatopsis sp.]|uniref:MFS transporter n=1 Tax=Amycolatopsis sp. TaxID=37632 RepID=UPI002D7F0C7F|nr:MFS transporter [Amycolatopsis sp.]HET6706956.1 MFS transporter [Amycolatopsis sp.]
MSRPAVSIDRRRWLVLAVVCLALTIVVIDNTVLTVAIPSLMRDLPASAAEAQWAFSSYLLVLSGFVLTGGAATDRYGRKRVLLTGTILFGAASLAAAFAAEPWQLIAARAVMGFAAALLMPATLAVLMHTFDETERPKAIGVWMAVSAVGSAAGPILGGFLISAFWWGAAFLINVPVCAACAIAVKVLVPGGQPARRDQRLDGVGALLSVVATVSLVWAISSVPAEGWFSARFDAFAVAGLLALAAFAGWELRSRAPMLDLGLFRNLRFTAAVLGGLLASFGMAGSLFLLTQHFQLVLGYGPVEASVRLLPLAVSVLLGSAVLSARAGRRLGAPAALLIGMTVAAAGLLLIGLLPVESYLGSLLGLVLVGLGLGVAGPVVGNALMSSIPLTQAGAGSGVHSTVQELGNGLGVAVLGTLLTGFFVAGLPPALAESGRTSFTDTVRQAAADPAAADLLARTREAFGAGLSASQLVGALAVFLGGAVAAWLLWLTRTADQAVPAGAQPDRHPAG